jgi:hypothetical protein
MDGMADARLRLRENAPGSFFVDSTRVACDVCAAEVRAIMSLRPTESIGEAD